jgi:hypothetical protein
MLLLLLLPQTILFTPTSLHLSLLLSLQQRLLLLLLFLET